MVKIEVEIPEAEHQIIANIARNLGLTVKDIVQQEVDRTLEAISCWIQRIQ